MDIEALAKLTRIEHGIMYALAVLAGIAVTGVFPSSYVLLLAFLVPLFSEMGAFAVNDYFDIAADRANRRTDRPLVSGRISPSFALAFGALSILFSLVFAFFINENIFLLTLVLNALALLYNAKLKLLPLAGNTYIAFTMGIPFVFGNLVVSSSIIAVNLLLFTLGFLAGLAREIIKSIEDIEGDRAARKAATLPVIIGEKYALATAIAVYLVFLPLSFLPFAYGLKGNAISYVLLAIAILLVLAGIFYSLKSDYRKSRLLSLAAFFIGLLAYLFAALFF